MEVETKPETHATPSKADGEIPQDTAGKLSRRILAVESALSGIAEWPKKPVQSSLALLLIGPLAVVAVFGLAFFLWRKRRKETVP